MTRKITITLPEETLKWLRTRSRVLHVSMAYAAPSLLEESRRESAAAKPSFMKLAGRLNGPGTLSTSRGFEKY